MSRRQFTKEFKIEAVQRMQDGESASALARELEVKRGKLYDWCAAFTTVGGRHHLRAHLPVEVRVNRSKKRLYMDRIEHPQAWTEPRLKTMLARCLR